MPSRTRTLLSLAGIVVLAAALSVALSAGAGASSLFQSSPPPTLIARPTLAQPTFPVPTAVPVRPTPTARPLASPTPLGFLPAPTLTNPNEALAVPHNTAGGAPRPDAAGAPIEAEATPMPEGSSLAALIDAAVATLGYAWLCCGGILLAAAAIIFVWLSRRAASP